MANSPGRQQREEGLLWRSWPSVGSPQGGWAIASSLPSLAFIPSGFIQMFPNQPLKDRRRSPFRAHGFSSFPGSAGHHHLPGCAGCPPGAGRAHPGPEDHPAGQEQLRRQGSVSTALLLSSLWYLHWTGQSRVDSSHPEAGMRADWVLLVKEQRKVISIYYKQDTFSFHLMASRTDR